MSRKTHHDPAPPDLAATRYAQASDTELEALILHGACATRRPPQAGADPYYPEDRAIGPERERRARAACRGCPVVQACLERALRFEAADRQCFGISGATSERRRRVILRKANWIWPRQDLPSAADSGAAGPEVEAAA